MTDPHETNHWDLLASKLGATPPPPDEKPPQVEADHKQTEPKVKAQVVPSRAAPPTADSPPKPRRAPTDWAQLAEQLGLERQEAAPAPAATAPGPESAAEATEAHEGATEVSPGLPAAPSESEQAACGSLGQDAQSTDAAPAFTESGLESTMPAIGPEQAAGKSTRTDLVPMGAEAELPGIPGGPARFAGVGEGKAQGRGRRKRRKRAQKPLDEKRAENALEKPGREPKEEQPAPLDEEPSLGKQPDDSAVAGLRAKEEQSKERSKRRRRRRSSAKKKGAGKRDDESGEPGRQDEVVAAPGDSESARAAAGKTNQAKPERAKAKSDGSKGSKSGNASKAAKGSHRSIPSWEEAVGIIITGNMEARAKRPSGSSSRSRGGRNRGGRDKSGEKAS